jgi:LPXTG-motif cell wall-anchored protein
MRVIRFSAAILFFALVIITVSALAHIKEARAAEASSIPPVAAVVVNADGNGSGLSGGGDLRPAPRYFPGPTETLLFGIALLVGGGFLRRRRRTNQD